MIEILDLNAYSFTFQIKKDCSFQDLLSFFHISKKKFNTHTIKPKLNFYPKNTICIIEFSIEENFPSINKDIQILYEDQILIAVYKPPFLLVHDDGFHIDNLQNRVNAYLKSQYHPHSAQAIHRIDTQCSGIVLFSRLPFFQGMLDEMIASHSCLKEYNALVKGKMNFKDKTVNYPISGNRHNSKEMIVHKNGKKAISHIHVLKTFSNYTLCQIQIETGRKHQIRLHLKTLGYPIVNDPVYGYIENQDGLLLENTHMAFMHPLFSIPIDIQVPLDDRFHIKK
ncbi:RluA family pseudouridine synthase [Floccifex sp.]|uniref:RluA family pseudouridine synthase n=1 Tax=Floccifex sp. TaxID=2815810 RepID=UPI003F10D63A